MASSHVWNRRVAIGVINLPTVGKLVFYPCGAKTKRVLGQFLAVPSSYVCWFIMIYNDLNIRPCRRIYHNQLASLCALKKKLGHQWIESIGSYNSPESFARTHMKAPNFQAYHLTETNCCFPSFLYKPQELGVFCSVLDFPCICHKHHKPTS